MVFPTDSDIVLFNENSNGIKLGDQAKFSLRFVDSSDADELLRIRVKSKIIFKFVIMQNPFLPCID